MSDEIEDRLPPLHPGQVLREDFLEPMQLSAMQVAKACGLPRTRIERILKQEIGITGDTALRLAAFFGTTPALWMNLQTSYEIEQAQSRMGPSIDSIKRFAPAQG